MNAPRLAQLFRELAAIAAEQARVHGAIADELEGATSEAAGPKPPRPAPVRAPYRPEPREVSDTARATAVRALRKIGAR